jgi:hypothetical protein
MSDDNQRKCVDCGATEDLIYTPGGVWVCSDHWTGELWESEYDAREHCYDEIDDNDLDDR